MCRRRGRSLLHTHILQVVLLGLPAAQSTTYAYTRDSPAGLAGGWSAVTIQTQNVCACLGSAWDTEERERARARARERVSPALRTG
jgi:hypothetical protein